MDIGKAGIWLFSLQGNVAFQRCNCKLRWQKEKILSSAVRCEIGHHLMMEGFRQSVGTGLIAYENVAMSVL